MVVAHTLSQITYGGGQAALVTSEGLGRTPIPLIYTHHTERFLGLWMLLLPLALVQAGSVIN